MEMQLDATMLPRLYPIIDRATLDARGILVVDFARELAEAGVSLMQYRDKVSGPQEVLRACGIFEEVFAGVDAHFIMNDRADLALLMGWGVHLGQKDLSVADARSITGCYATIGLSTHTEDQIFTADTTTGQRDRSRVEPWQGDDPSTPDYIAIGPVFATGTKADAEPFVGLEGVRRARALTKKPLVAIGGITHENARSVIEAGADSVAVIGGLFVEGMSVADATRDFLARLR